FDAIYTRRAVETTSDLSKMLLIYLLIENVVNSERRVRSFFWVLTLAGMFPALGTIHHAIRGIYQEGTRASWIGIFRNPNEDASSLVLLILIAAVLARTSRPFVRILLWSAMAVYVLAIYLTFSRGGLLGLFAIVALIGWKQRSMFIRLVLIAGL